MAEKGRVQRRLLGACAVSAALIVSLVIAAAGDPVGLTAEEAEAAKVAAGGHRDASAVSTPDPGTVRALWAQQQQATLPVTERAGYWIADDLHIEIYVKADAAAVTDTWAAAIAKSGFVVRVVSVPYSQQEIESVREAYRWTSRGVPRALIEGVLSSGFDARTNSLHIEVVDGWQGSASQLANFLGVPVTVSVGAVPA